MASDDKDPTVKELLDAATRADLERWFGLPSFEQVAERPPEQLSEREQGAKEVLDRRAKAAAAADPAFVAALLARADVDPATLLPRQQLDIDTEHDIAQCDYAMADQRASFAEPREVEIPQQLIDDLHECTPQALLRDLHRAELFFDKMFEIVDVTADQRLDIVAEVAHAMTTSWKLPAMSTLPSIEGRALLDELRRELRSPWSDIPKQGELRNRRIVE